MVMDLFGQRSPERIRLDPSPERFRAELAALDGVTVASDGGDRVRYRQMLVSSHFGIAPFREGCPWSMSVIDCQGMGLPVIAPRTGWPAEHIDDELLFDTPDEALSIASRLRHRRRVLPGAGQARLRLDRRPGARPGRRPLPGGPAMSDFDAVMLSYDEPIADRLHARLQRVLGTRVKRLHGVQGMRRAYRLAAEVTDSEQFLLADGDFVIATEFDLGSVAPSPRAWPCGCGGPGTRSTG